MANIRKMRVKSPEKMHCKYQKNDYDSMLQALNTNYIIISKKNIVKWKKK